MYIFENDIKLSNAPFKMFDEITKPNKIERKKGMARKLRDKRKNQKVPVYKKNKIGRFSYLSTK